ncbi:hypothetical protein HHK36_005198 [Tetracentron sinense]|uniref:Uncharacterized protein n=1 Tax=Tetracentron sinense TaxID=13715 RepID=A0A834ZNY1_TETSI|nr:hypothetical protein HHK36_005198 [Tetracentron sinense]
MFFGRVLLVWVIGFSCLFSFAFGATILPDDEEEVLRQIAKKLGKTNWKFSVDPCSRQGGWVSPSPNPNDKLPNGVTCNCSLVNSTGCHVASIHLKSLSLPGVLSPELAQLPYLREIGVTAAPFLEINYRVRFQKNLETSPLLYLWSSSPIGFREFFLQSLGICPTLRDCKAFPCF